ncbi:hypothetical protein [Roseibium marinum]|uniref:Uncharacterized protein n=1 Tax=Roseibium marinum TaxID=281252 RepID=A0A2S3V1C0_9HYPH|nr:hypothetical protein [Roseibium marinum]POF33771.1 hypothetical protein CLV41_101220 [Roseibium marinum]
MSSNVNTRSSDWTSKHIYIAVPRNGGSDPFSGQYLRLEEYVGGDEDSHLPNGVATSGLTGISISSTGHFLLKSGLGVYETFAKGLRETVSGAGHTITIDKGDWKLVADNGSVTITTGNTGVGVGTMKFKSTGSDIEIKALKGMYYSSDKRDIKTSESDSVKFIAGYEYSGVLGHTRKINSGFAMSINVIGDLYIKTSDVKFTGIALKMTAFSHSFVVASIKGVIVNFKIGVIMGKKMIVYNKLTAWQVYFEMAKDEKKAFQVDAELNGMETAVAHAESAAMNVSMWQLIKM